MTLQTYLNIVRERWTLIAACLLAGIVVAGAINLLLPRQFSATATLYMSARIDNSVGAAYQANLLSQQSVKSYTELVPSPRLSEDVRQRTGTSLTEEDLKAKLSATNSADTVLIAISAIDPDPALAAAIANAAGDSLIGIVSDVERPIVAGQQPPLALKMVQPAVAPQTPSSMAFLTAITIGALLGLFIGLLAAMIRHYTDVSLRSVNQLGEITRAPNLAAIERYTDSRNQEDSFSRTSEAFKRLRTNLQFVSVDSTSKVILVTSPLQGSGKSTVALGLARELSAGGYKTILVDADLRRPRVAEATGVEGAVGVSTILSGRARPSHAVHRVADGGFDVLPAGIIPPNPSELLASQQMEQLLADLRVRYDLVLVDTTPVLPVSDATALAPRTDGVLLVCSYHHESISDIGRTVESLGVTSVPILGTVYNMAPVSNSPGYGGAYSYEYVPQDRKSRRGLKHEEADEDATTVKSPTPFRRQEDQRQI